MKNSILWVSYMEGSRLVLEEGVVTQQPMLKPRVKDLSRYDSWGRIIHLTVRSQLTVLHTKELKENETSSKKYINLEIQITKLTFADTKHMDKWVANLCAQ